jgi:DNA-directed RNA polymerase
MMGAAQVNLIPAERPSDVYTGVSQLVTAAVERDAENGDEMAKILQDKISRKVVKQTVMTNVYGVTFIGAKDQIMGQLKDLPSLAEYKQGNPKFSFPQMALYLTNKVFDSISTMFYGASRIQEWLGSSAKRISLSVSPSQIDQSISNEDTPTPEKPKKKSKKGKGEGGDVELPPSRKKKDIHFMTSVVWTTPLRLPVVQPYRHDKVQLVITNLQNVYITDPSVIDEINSRKQMMAFPPNFIHSLDATHMLMSAKRCHDENLTFASVHDSFWTHPSDVDTLNRILREAFIDLHSSEVMNNLKAEFEVRYKGHMYLASLDAAHPISAAVKVLRDTYSRDVLKKKVSSRGVATLTLIEDLHWERQRALLLESENEEERKMGEEMITPSVLVERMGGLGSLGEETPEETESEHPEGEDHDLELHTLNPVLADSETAVDETMSPNLAGDEELEEGKTKTESASKQKPQVTRIWMPLKFPDLPPKVSPSKIVPIIETR